MTPLSSPGAALDAPAPRRIFAVHFAAAAIPLVALKLGLVLNHAFGTEAAGEAGVTLAKSLLFFGGDLTGAALLAGLLALVARALRPRAGRLTALSLPLHALHGAFAGFSTVSVVELGGPVNKQLLEAAWGQIGQWSSQMAASTADYFRPWLLAVMAGATLGPPTLALLLARRPTPRASRARRWFAGLLVAEAVTTVALVPFMTAGQVGFRIRSNGLEKSPWLELAASYLRSPFRRLLAGDTQHGNDGFWFDFASVVHPPGETLETPLTRATPKRTNVLFILMESIGEPYRQDPGDPMPFVRGLQAREDTITFGDHYATWSLTTQVIFSILCSEMPYPSYVSISFINPGIPCKSLSEHLHDAGWFTALVTPSDLEFDRKKRFLRHRKFDLTWDAQSIPGREGAWRGPWGLEEQVAVRGVLDAVRRAGDQPFFILYNQLAGHHPFIASEAQAAVLSEDRYTNYLSALRVADDGVRDAIEGLRALGKLDDTLVVLVSDHGEGHGRHAGRGVWTPIVRVPMLLFGPQTRGLRATIDATTTQLDLAPTILGLLGLPIPCTMKGRDLSRPSQHRLAFFGGRPPNFQIGLADGPWNFILEDGSLEMLFDVRQDPGEQHNLVDDHPELAAAYRRRVEAWTYHAAELTENYTSTLATSGCRP